MPMQMTIDDDEDGGNDECNGPIITVVDFAGSYVGKPI